MRLLRSKPPERLGDIQHVITGGSAILITIALIDLLARPHPLGQTPPCVTCCPPTP